MKRKKVFKIFNATNLESFTWIFDKKAMQGSGFSIEPEKIEKLPPMIGVDVAVTLLTKDGGRLGRKNTVVPIELKSGGLGAPTVQLVLSANICLPEIAISDELIDFDRVMMGRSRKMFLRLHNTSPVSAKWNFKLPVTSDMNRFLISPTSGSLRADGKVLTHPLDLLTNFVSDTPS